MHFTMQRTLQLSLIWLLPKALGTSRPEQHILRQTPLCPREPYEPWQISSTCPIDDGLTVSRNETAPIPDDEWIRGNVCLELPGGSDSGFCTFTHLSFNGGLGVSIVTTPEVFEKISALPVFTGGHRSTVNVPEASPVPYRDVSIPGKGIGLVATTPVRTSEVYMARTPAVMLDDTAFRLLGRSRLTTLLTKAVDDLPREHRAEYLNLTTHSEMNTHEDRVYAIFMKNNFQTAIQDVEVFHSTFTQGERGKSACWFSSAC